MVNSYGALLRRATGDNPEEMGTVRVSASEIMGTEVLPNIVKAFCQKHQGIKIELSISNRFDNLLKREADIAVRMNDPKQEALIAKKIGISSVGLFAHKSYINTYGKPRSLADLNDHRLIGPDTDTLFFQVLQSFGIVVSRDDLAVRVDNQIVQQELIRKGVGIGVMQQKIAIHYKSLVHLLPDDISIQMPIWLVMHEDLKASRRIRLLFEFLSEKLEDFLESSY